MKIFKVYCLNNFQIHNTVLLTIAVGLCISSPGITYFITRSLCLLPSFTPSLHPPTSASGNHPSSRVCSSKVPGSFQRIMKFENLWLKTLPHLNSPTMIWGRCSYHAHFTEKETEIHREGIITSHVLSKWWSWEWKIAPVQLQIVLLYPSEYAFVLWAKVSWTLGSIPCQTLH